MYKIEWPGDAREQLFTGALYETVSVAVHHIQAHCTGFDAAGLEKRDAGGWYVLADGQTDADETSPYICYTE